MDLEGVFLELLSARIGAKPFDRWFGNEVRITLGDNTLQVQAPTPFLADWIRTTFKHDIAKVCLELFGTAYPIRFSSRSVEAVLAVEVSPTVTESLPKTKAVPKVAPVAQAVPENKAKVGKSVARRAVPPATPLLPSLSDELYEVDADAYNTVKLKSSSTSTSTSTAQSVRPSDGRVFANFTEFVIGPSNSFAKGVADIAVSDPGRINPVLVFGPTSVGKTHLLESIWSEYRTLSKRKHPLYMTAEQFTTQFVQSFKLPTPFRKRFESISLLVLDDLHFLQGKTATQQELISLIDWLKSRKVQMVFSADRPLAELRALRGELLSRLDEGLVCSIESPERETLLKIFRQMAIQRRLNVSDEVCRFVVSRFTSHARQLSGALNRLHASWLASGTPLTLENAEIVLSDLVQSNRRVVRLEDIENAVLEMFGLPDASLRSKSRARQTSYPRMLAMYLARKYTRSALSEIGRYFGNRTHSTVISAQKRIDQLLKENKTGVDSGPEQVPGVAETLRRIERILRV